MATHVIAWQQSIDAPTLAAITTVVDDVLTRTGTTRYIIPPLYNRVLWATAVGPNITRAQLITPSLLVRRMNPEIVPRSRGDELLALTGLEVFVPRRPMILIPGEEIEAQAAEDAVGASQLDVVAALSLAELPPIPDGDIRIVRGTGTTTLAVRAWTSVVLTLDSSLEAGTYALVGLVAISANVLAARAIITGQQFRPGVPGFSGTEAIAVGFDPALFNQIAFYHMGDFTHITVPAIQFFSSVADTSETVFLYVVRTGPAPTGG